MDNVVVNITEVVDQVLVSLNEFGDEVLVYITAPDSIPRGGTTGQLLSKASNGDYNTAWTDPPVTVVSAPATQIMYGTGSGFASSSNFYVTLDVFNNPTVFIGGNSGVLLGVTGSFGYIQGVGYNDFKILARNSASSITLSVAGDITHLGNHIFAAGTFNVNTGQASNAISIATNGTITLNPNNSTVKVISYLEPDRIGKPSTQSVLLMETNSNIAHGSIGFADNSDDAIFNWFGKIKIGNDSPLSFPRDFMIAKPHGVSLVYTSTPSNGYVETFWGQNGLNYGYSVKFNTGWGSTSYIGTSVNVADTMYFTNIIGGGTNTSRFVIAPYAIMALNGQAETNSGFRSDEIGLRVHRQDKLHTVNTMQFQVGDQLMYDESIAGGQAAIWMGITSPASNNYLFRYNGLTAIINTMNNISFKVAGGSNLLDIDNTGITLSSLAGTGTRMVVADSSGKLSTMPLP
jgi:hypothetical protein